MKREDVPSVLTKCKVEDLLPNVSLRQAIEHFLESQGLVSGSDNIFQKYAPDEASGIQAKEFGCRAVWCLFKFAGLVTEFAGFLMSQNLEERLHIVVKPIPVADETLSESGSTQSNLRLDSLIIEAIANLKERNGSNRTSIATYMRITIVRHQISEGSCQES